MPEKWNCTLLKFLKCPFLDWFWETRERQLQRKAEETKPTTFLHALRPHVVPLQPLFKLLYSYQEIKKIIKIIEYFQSKQKATSRVNMNTGVIHFSLYHPTLWCCFGSRLVCTHLIKCITDLIPRTTSKLEMPRRGCTEQLTCFRSYKIRKKKRRKKGRKKAVLLVHRTEGRCGRRKSQGASSHPEFLAVNMEAAQRKPLQLWINHQTGCWSCSISLIISAPQSPLDVNALWTQTV